MHSIIIFTGFSSNGLLDDGKLGGDVTAGDLITGIGSYSGTIFAVVPEPLTIMGTGLCYWSGRFL